MNVNYIVDKLNHKHMKAIVHTTTMCIVAVLSFIIPAMLCTMTQSRTVQHIHRMEFEQCIGDDISDDMCDSCYHAVLDHHHYWFNNDLYNEE